jgi:hypothetical protein
MTLGRLLVGIIFLILGCILHYFLLPKIEEPDLKQKINLSFLSRSMLGSIFILVGLQSILMFCLGIDGGNYTSTKEDDMNILSGIAIGICILLLERNIVRYLQRFKTYRQLKKGINKD